VEAGDTDFVKPSEGSKTISLTIDEVNDNADELVELVRHKKANCKTVVCMACGMVDDHYSQHCPKSIVCSNCGEKGHYKNQCTQKQRRVYCQTCSSTRHFSDRCTSIWRSYLTTKDSDRKMGLPTNIYCYNCAEKGHYGDECPSERTSRVPNLDGSAFSGHNLPQQLRDKYFSLHKKRRRDDDYDEDDRYNDNYSISSDSKKDQKKKNGLFNRIKDTFKRNKGSDGYDDEGPSKKKNKPSKKEIRKAQSTPNFNNRPIHKSGVLPPPAANRSSLDYPRNPSYNNGYQQGGYSRVDSYNQSYNQSYNNPEL
ncbi:unnamed protein product, partial [Wickerhamomyces anomalus]